MRKPCAGAQKLERVLDSPLPTIEPQGQRRRLLDGTARDALRPWHLQLHREENVLGRDGADA
eukprot:11187916-Lingulodinium_polyedra.AAC.1